MEDTKRKVFDQNLPPFERLVALMAVLRSEEGCAWDRKQTHESLLPYLIEEAHEVVEAVQSGNFGHLREELGDLICQVVFHAQLADEAGRFDVNDSIETIVEKLIRRHPHVFGEKKELTPKQVRNQWEKVKIESGEKKSVLSGIPASMPALTMAYRIGEKVGGVGFDWTEPADVLDKMAEETDEIKAEIEADDKERLSEEIGDLLFAVASLARKFEINPELALKRALGKFSARFSRLEQEVKASDRPFGEYTLDQLEAIWQRVK